MCFAVHSDIGVLKACQGLSRWHCISMQNHCIHPAVGYLPEHKRAFDTVFCTYREKLHDTQELYSRVSKRLAEDSFLRVKYAFEQGNLDSYKECLAFAATTYPKITASSSWTRLQYKEFIGPRLWSRLRQGSYC